MSLAEFKWLLAPLKPVNDNYVGTFSLLRTVLRYRRFYHYYYYREPNLGRVVLIVYFPWRSKLARTGKRQFDSLRGS